MSPVGRLLVLLVPWPFGVFYGSGSQFKEHPIQPQDVKIDLLIEITYRKSCGCSASSLASQTGRDFPQA
jgi:hypothetical protein